MSETQSALESGNKQAQLASLGALGFNPQEIETILNTSPKDDHQVIQRGRLLAEMEFRQNVYRMAKEGSPHAMREYLRFSRKSKRYLRAIDLPVDYMAFSQKEMACLDGLLMFNGNISKACKYANISRKTYYNWLSDPRPHYRRFTEAAKLAGDMLNDAVEEVIMDKMLIDEDTNMIQFYAQTKMKDRGYTKHVVVSSEDQMAQLPDGSISPAGQEMVRSMKAKKKMQETVAAALHLIADDDPDAADAIEDAEFTEVKDD